MGLSVGAISAGGQRNWSMCSFQSGDTHPTRMLSYYLWLVVIMSKCYQFLSRCICFSKKRSKNIFLKVFNWSRVFCWIPTLWDLWDPPVINISWIVCCHGYSLCCVNQFHDVSNSPLTACRISVFSFIKLCSGRAKAKAKTKSEIFLWCLPFYSFIFSLDLWSLKPHSH